MRKPTIPLAIVLLAVLFLAFQGVSNVAFLEQFGWAMNLAKVSVVAGLGWCFIWMTPGPRPTSNPQQPKQGGTKP